MTGRWRWQSGRGERNNQSIITKEIGKDNYGLSERGKEERRRWFDRLQSDYAAAIYSHYRREYTKKWKESVISCARYRVFPANSHIGSTYGETERDGRERATIGNLKRRSTNKIMCSRSLHLHDFSGFCQSSLSARASSCLNQSTLEIHWMSTTTWLSI